MKLHRLGLFFPLGVLLLLGVCLAPLTLAAQESAAAPAVAAASRVVPSLINYSGVLKVSTGRTLTSLTGVTFLIYKDDQGGAPLWMETQNIAPDKTGHYNVQLGLASKNGIPPDLFMNGEARWLAVQIGTEAEQARVLLVAVPYAMKSIDAQTLGGLPPSAFVIAAPPTSGSASATNGESSSSSTSAPPPTNPTVTTSGVGTLNTIPFFNTATNIEKSIMSQSGGNTINVGGKLNHPATGTATALKGFNSQPDSFVASVFNSGTATPVAQTFQLQAEPANNDKTTGTGTLNLLYATGTAVPAETGLKINSKGQITFAPGQANIPGAGTVKSVGLTAPATDFAVTGSPVTGTGTLNLAWKVAPTNANTANAIVKRDASGNFAASTITASALVAAGAVTAAQVTSGGTVNVDENGTNAGTELPGVQFGAGNSGEAISSARISGFNNLDGLDFYTNFASRMSITNRGQVGIGTQFPSAAWLDVVAPLFDGSNGLNATGSSPGPGSFLNGGAGASLTGGNGDLGDLNSDGDGVDATNVDGGTFSASLAYAGNFTGDLNVTGAITAGTKDFKIDHPLDPANKYLFHSSVESSEMMNIYTGNVLLDASGEAKIELPDWFEALNRDFCYQLTAIGKPSPGLYIAEEISGNQFRIAGGTPGAKVSWQVTGARQDAYAKAHPLVVEQEKEARVKGFYIHPELYGAPDEKQIEWARNPAWMHQIKEMKSKRNQAKPTAQQPTKTSHASLTPVVNTR